MIIQKISHNNLGNEDIILNNMNNIIGKIFVYSLDNVIKIRTGEEGIEALADAE